MADYFDELNAFASRLVGDAQGMTQDNPPPESTPSQTIAVGEPDPTGGEAPPPVTSEVDGSTPALYWWQPRRYFTGMSGEAADLVQQARSAEQGEAEPQMPPAAMPRRYVSAMSGAAAPNPTEARPGPAGPPASTGRPVRYRIGAYIVPSEPSLPFSDYFRQFEFADPEAAKNKVAELAKLGIPPYYWDGRSWIPLYRSA